MIASLYTVRTFAQDPSPIRSLDDKMGVMPTPFGILNVDKPAGLTSRDAVNRIEGLVRGVKCGHAGTLDPLATGVLVVCVGPATRLIQYVQRMPKHYQAVFQLGRRSVTDDIEGEVELVADAAEPTRAEIEAVLPQFVGEIEQRPPAFSAIKVAGQRAYDLARRGDEFELPVRTITIYRLELLRYEYPELELAIECGSGTYVRSLGRDLAAALGTAAVMSSLVRTAIGDFRVENAVALDAITNSTFAEHLQPPIEALKRLPQLALNDRELAELRHGRPIERRGVARSPAEAGSPSAARSVAAAASPSAEWAAVDPAGRLAAILFEKHPNQLWPARNFEA
jgi:tRNA pseudouridine55 synthase